jgi:enoyl-CoA hydratase
MGGVGTLVEYRVDGRIATITMDDGKVNALSNQMLDELNAALDRAEEAGAVVRLIGREGVFSAGFDLTTLRGGGPDALAMVRAGFELALRVLSFPTPVIVACTGHAVAMGAFLVLSGDFRIGVAGPYRIQANEVAIGLTLPEAALEILRQRLNPAHLTRAALLAEAYTPDTAIEAGFLDRVVPADELIDAAEAVAEAAGRLSPGAHAASKLRARRSTLDVIRAAIDADARELGGSA